MRGRYLYAFLITIAYGLILELEEGATQTGNCRLRDLLPDATGALIGMGVLTLISWSKSSIENRHLKS